MPSQRPAQSGDTADRTFIARMMRQPLLAADDEFALAAAWRDKKDEKALKRLTSAYLRLVVAMASRFKNYGLPLSDLVQEGTVGLMQAADRFEPERGIRFSTYAAWWVRAAMQDFILRNWSIVRTGTTASQKSLFFNLRRLRLSIERASGRPLDDEGRKSIATTLKVQEHEVEAMDQRLGGRDQSLNAPLANDGERELQDVLVDEGPQPEEIVIEADVVRRRSDWLAEAMATLNARERLILAERNLGEGEPTLEDLGQRLGISKERVRQLESRALTKLKDALVVRGATPEQLFV